MRFLIDATACARAHWRLKATLSAVLTVVFAVPYFTLQRVVLFPIRRLELTSLDQAVAFDPRWVGMYQSVYLLIALVPWMAITRTDLLGYARGFLLLSLMGFVCFLLFPVASPRPDTVPAAGLYAWLVWYDGPTNTIPSLHVGLAAYTLLFGARISRGVLDGRLRRPMLLAGGLWVAAIAYAALATKQHYLLDLPAGVLVAAVAHRWALRHRRSADARSGFTASSIGEPGR